MKGANAYLERKTVGIIPLNNWGGIEILYINQYAEWIVTCLNTGEDRVEPKKHKLFWDLERGEYFFRRFKQKYYLSEVMKP